MNRAPKCFSSMTWHPVFFKSCYTRVLQPLIKPRDEGVGGLPVYGFKQFIVEINIVKLGFFCCSFFLNLVQLGWHFATLLHDKNVCTWTYTHAVNYKTLYKNVQYNSVQKCAIHANKSYFCVMDSSFPFFLALTCHKAVNMCPALCPVTSIIVYNILQMDNPFLTCPQSPHQPCAASWFTYRAIQVRNPNIKVNRWEEGFSHLHWQALMSVHLASVMNIVNIQVPQNSSQTSWSYQLNWLLRLTLLPFALTPDFHLLFTRSTHLVCIVGNKVGGAV